MLVLQSQISTPVRRSNRGRLIARICGALLAELVRGFFAGLVAR